LLTGKKLLLADDSAAVRKVIELTFADEGMEVITVGDGRSALERFELVVPDLVLADVYMPEMGGYELCRSIKQDERFAKTPVVLLISSFEPFDESEARRAGADDVVTKPFQSIRQLVSRVGSLLNKGEEESEMAHQYSTLGINQTESVAPAPLEEQASEPQVTVLVEAPIMEHVEPAGVTCSTDVELLTADTMQLERIVDEPVQETSADDLSMQDTIEIEPVSVETSEAQPAPPDEPPSEHVSYGDITEPTIQAAPAPAMKFEEAVLDLEDEFLGEPQMVADDVFLDLDFAESASGEIRDARIIEEPPVPVAFDESVPVAETIETERMAPAAASDEWALTPESSGQQRVEPITEEQVAPLLTQNGESLSPAAIDAIARRMVEQMSDKVVREIAWEVVPELSELLIKQKLEETK
jgi:twitching motility two-component system response regulator PilG